MTTEFVQYIMSFIGGGFAVAVGNWVNSAVAARKQREGDYLKSQLQSLYGPLFFFTQQNENLFALCRKFNDAYTTEFVAQSWSEDSHTQASVQKDSATTIEISNQYIRRVVENNERVMDVLEKGWHFIDADDIKEFANFQVDFTRLKVEVDGTLKPPNAIYKAVGNISYMSPSMIERVKLKAQEKEARLRELMRPWWQCDG
ncbi:MAG: hypothetical protein K8R50_08465 [Betaproteobacteria bacterium]|nr:hypothetical protein [Betaproteobacteria bacterium]MCX7196225.1 hypothetical protein [Pseudomonadota bacterium]